MTVRWRSQFKKDYKRMMRQGKDINKLDYVINELAAPNPLPEQYRYIILRGIGRDIKSATLSRIGS